MPLSTRYCKTRRYKNVVCCEVKILHSEQNPSAAPNSFRGERGTAFFLSFLFLFPTLCCVAPGVGVRDIASSRLKPWRERQTVIVGVLPVPVGVVRSPWVTLIPNSASSANAACMLDVFAMVPFSNVLSPFALLAPLPPRFGHSRALGNLGALGSSTKMGRCSAQHAGHSPSWQPNLSGSLASKTSNGTKWRNTRNAGACRLARSLAIRGEGKKCDTHSADGDAAGPTGPFPPCVPANQILTRFFSLQAWGGGCKVHRVCLQGCI